MKHSIYYIILFILISLTFLLICGFAHQWKEILIVEKVIVENNNLISESEIIKISNIKVGDRLFSLSLDSIRNRLLTHKYIKDANVKRRMKGNICISIYERIPIATLNLGKTWYIDDEGIVLPVIQSNIVLDLPVISGLASNSLKVASEVELPSVDVCDALTILRVANNIGKDLYFLISEINLNRGNDIVIYTSDYGIRVIIGREHYEKKLKLLSSFWKQFVITRGANNLESVDLRFNDQVVVRWNKVDKEFNYL